MTYRNTDFDDLDDRIRIALHIECSREQVARLEDFWHQQSRTAERRRRVRRAALLAASILVAMTALALLAWPESSGRPTAIEDTNSERRSTPVVASVEEDKRAPQPEPAPKSSGRAATAYERFMFAAHSTSSAAKAPALSSAVDSAIDRLMHAPETAPRQIAETSGLMEFSSERFLLRRLARSSIDRKHSILRLLSVCGTQRCVPALLRLGRRDEFRSECLAVVEDLVGLKGLPDIARQTADWRTRAAIYDRLLTADSAIALDGLLSLVQDDAFRREALAAVETASPWLRRELFARLQSERKETRLAAALVLGQANGPEITQSLIRMVTAELETEKVDQDVQAVPSQEPCPAEAWIALCACRGEGANRFLRYAMSEPRLLGRVNWGCLLLERMRM